MAQAVPFITQGAKATTKAFGDLGAGKAKYYSAMGQADQKDVDARDAVIAASKQEDEMRSSARKTIGAQLAAGAESGVALSGSRLDMLHESYLNEEADAAYLRNQGLSVYRTNKQHAAQLRQQGKNELKASKVNAWVTGLTGVADMAESAGKHFDAKAEAAKKQEAADQIVNQAGRKFSASDALKTFTYSGKSRKNILTPSKEFDSFLKPFSNIKTPKISK